MKRYVAVFLAALAASVHAAPVYDASTGVLSLTNIAIPVGTSTVCYDATLSLTGTTPSIQFTLIGGQQVSCNVVPSGTSYNGTALVIQAVTVTGTGCYDVTMSLAASSPTLLFSLSEAKTATCPITLGGVAAVGAPLSGAKVTVYDRTGNEVGSQAAVNEDGAFQTILAPSAAAPFVLVASQQDDELVSVASDASSSNLNITPITNLIASRLSSNGDPKQLVGDVRANPAAASAGAVSAKVAEVNTLLKPVTDAAGIAIDPLTGKFAANGSGHDRILDTVAINIVPSGSNADVEVAIKPQGSDSAQPNAVTFASNASQLPAITSVSASSLAPDGITKLIAALAKSITGCFALPLAQRVSNGQIVAGSACQTMFAGANPAGYLHNGNTVGPDGAFSGLFSDSSTGTAFGNGVFDHTRKNGDIVLSLRKKDTAGNVSYFRYVARNENGALKLIGNQYRYDGGINAFHQLREFVNQPNATYYSVGYTLGVNNSVDAAGNSIFDRVVVTSPKGKQITLLPTSGYSYLTIANSAGNPSGTNFVRFRSVFASAAVTGYPGDYDTGLFFLDASAYPTDASITELYNHSAWQFDYFLAGNKTSTPDATQTYRTKKRAHTIGEFRARPLPSLSTATLAAIKAASVSVPTSSGGVRMAVPLPASGSVAVSWTQPSGSLPVTEVRLWGFSSTGAAFDDNKGVKSTASSANISCAKQTSADPHCSGSNFAANTYYDNLRLKTETLIGDGFEHHYVTYTVPGIP
jgi:hypothetical protein